MCNCRHTKADHPHGSCRWWGWGSWCECPKYIEDVDSIVDLIIDDAAKAKAASIRSTRRPVDD